MVHIETINALVAFLTLIITGVSLYFTIRLTFKVNSTDYKVREDLTLQLLELRATIKSIKSKLAVSHRIKVDCSPEIENISRLRMRPAYQLFLKSLNQNDMFMLEINLLLQAGSNKPLPIENLNKIESILEDEKSVRVIEKLIKNQRHSFLREFRGDMGVFPMLTPMQMDSSNSNFERFIKRLVEFNHINTDPDVNLFYAVIEKDPNTLKKAIDGGANVNITEKEILERYHNEWESFLHGYEH